MDIREAVREFLASKNRLQPLTKKGYEQKLAVFTSFCVERRIELQDVKTKVVDDFLDYLQTSRASHYASRKEVSQITLVGYVRVIRSFLNWCAEDEIYGDYVKPTTVKRIKLPKLEHYIIEPFSEEHIQKLLRACEKGESEHLRLRDRCIILVLLYTGIRAEELCTLKLKNTHLEADDPYIKVMGKGRKEREVGLNKETRVELRRYIRKYRSQGEYTFVSRNQTKPLGVWGLDQIFDRLNEWAQITDVRVSPHTMRHTFASNWIKEGKDIYTLSKILGHSSIKTTEEYLKSITSRDVRKVKQEY